MKTNITRQQAKQIGEGFGILVLGLGLALLWFPMFRIIISVYEFIQCL